MSGQYAAPTRSHLTAKVPDGVLRYTYTRLSPAADAAVAITDVVNTIVLNSTTGAKAITTTSAREGQEITILAGTVSGGSYTLAVLAIAGGADELTFNAAGEVATIIRLDGVWVVKSLHTATVV
jgi:hypothetical protein